MEEDNDVLVFLRGLMYQRRGDGTHTTATGQWNAIVQQCPTSVLWNQLAQVLSEQFGSQASRIFLEELKGREDLGVVPTSIFVKLHAKKDTLTKEEYLLQRDILEFLVAHRPSVARDMIAEHLENLHPLALYEIMDFVDSKDDLINVRYSDYPLLFHCIRQLSMGYVYERREWEDRIYVILEHLTAEQKQKKFWVHGAYVSPRAFLASLLDPLEERFTSETQIAIVCSLIAENKMPAKGAMSAAE